MAAHAEVSGRAQPLFKPALARSNLIGLLDAGYIVGDRYDPAKPMGSIAASQLDTFVRAALLGLSDRLWPLIGDRIEWLNLALAAGQGLTSHFDRATQTSSLALYQWLRDGHGAASAWADALDGLERSMATPGEYSKRDAPTYGLDDFMLFALLADQPQRGLDKYRALKGERLPAVAKVASPRDWGALRCRHEVFRDQSEDQLMDAAHRMLRTHLDDPWLGRGQAARAAMWLMAIHWRPHRDRSPRDVLLRAFEDLPAVDGAASPSQAST